MFCLFFLFLFLCFYFIVCYYLLFWIALFWLKYFDMVRFNDKPPKGFLPHQHNFFFFSLSLWKMYLLYTIVYSFCANQ